MTLSGVRRPHGLRRQGDGEAGGLSLGKAVYYGGADLLDLTAGPDGRRRWLEVPGRRPDPGGRPSPTSPPRGCYLLAYQRGEDAGCGEGSAGFAPVVARPPGGPGHAAYKWRQLLQRGCGRVSQRHSHRETPPASRTRPGRTCPRRVCCHILAVSGMHCGFLMTLMPAADRPAPPPPAGGAGRCPSWCSTHFSPGPAPRWSGPASWCCSWLGGAPVPAGQRRRRRPCSAALFLILLANPFAAASISLQLSFGAMAGLLWLTPRIQDLLLGERSPGKGVPACWPPACRPPWGPWCSRCPCAPSTSAPWC